MGRVRHSFAPSGRWRIAFINGIAPRNPDQSEHFQQVFLRSAETDNAVSAKLIAREVPFGETLDLWHGPLLDDGIADQETIPAGFEEFSLPVDLQTDSIRVVQRGDVDDNGQLVVPSRLPRSVLAAVRKAWFLLIPGPKGAQIFIPCQEIFRFYYLISSRLGRTILRGDILQHDQHLYDERQTTGPDAEGHMTLALRRGVLESDATIVARWVVGSDKVGLSRAMNIALHFVTQHRTEPYIPIHALPPFDGATTWNALGRRVVLRGQSYLFVCRLISCSAPFGFETLEWHYADERPPRVEDPPDDPPERLPSGGSRKKAPSTLKFVYLEEDTERPGNKFIPDVFPIDNFSERFPSVNSRGISRKFLERDDEKVRNTRITGVEPKLAKALTTRPGASNGDDQSQSVDFTVARGDDNELDGVQPEERPAAALEHALTLCRSLARKPSVTWRDVAIGPGRAVLDNHQFALMPAEINGVKKRFLYLDERRTERRPVYIAEFEQDGKFGYLLELVRKPSERFSMLLLRSPQGRISNEALRATIDQIAVSASVVLPDTLVQSFDFQVKRMIHLFDRPIPERVAVLSSYWNFTQNPSNSPGSNESSDDA